MGWYDELIRLASLAVSEYSLVILAALFGVAALTEMGFPFPFLMDGVLFYTGFEPGRMPLRVLAVMGVLFLGRVVGASIVYWLGRGVGTPFVAWLGRKFPRFARTMDGLKKRLGLRAPVTLAVGRVGARAPVLFDLVWLALREPTAVALARLTPGLLSAASVASGVIHMRYWVFVLGIFLASLAADGALILSGVVAEVGLEFLGISPSPWMFLVALVAVVLLIWGVPKLISSRKARRNCPPLS